MEKYLHTRHEWGPNMRKYLPLQGRHTFTEVTGAAFNRADVRHGPYGRGYRLSFMEAFKFVHRRKRQYAPSTIFDVLRCTEKTPSVRTMEQVTG
eukprot:1143540-Pyramimonas_sp.AAC.1